MGGILLRLFWNFINTEAINDRSDAYKSEFLAKSRTQFDFSI